VSGSAWVVSRRSRGPSVGDRCGSVAELVAAILKGRVITVHGFMMEFEEDRDDALHLVGLIQKLDERCRELTKARAQDRARAEWERNEPFRRAEAERRARVQVEEQIKREEAEAREAMIQQRARELAGTAEPKGSK